MFRLLHRVRRRTDGAAAVEFALFAPMFLMILVAMVEFGRVHYEAILLERSVRGAVAYAQRVPCCPLSAADKTIMRNMIRTGNADGTLPYLMLGWATAPSSEPDIDDTQTYTLVNDGSILPLITVRATVPYKPLMPGIFDILGMSSFNIHSNHQAPHVGE